MTSHRQITQVSQLGENLMSKEFVLLQQDIDYKGILQPEIPDNLNDIEELKVAGFLTGVASAYTFSPYAGAFGLTANLIANKTGLWKNMQACH